MARNLDPKCKQCRREGEKLFLKGERCFTQKCAAVKRNYPPGQTGQNQSRRKISEYGVQLREKRKAQKFYNVLEKQLRNYYLEANKKQSATGKTIIQLLEKRLDNVVFRLSLTKSRSQARQMVSHGHVRVNDQRVTIPSYSVKVGDVIEVTKATRQKKGFANIIKEIRKEEVPSWLEVNTKNATGKIVREPTLDDVGHKINTSLIVEFYSR
ncbi:30S ribosomal protein S4 [Patescibacteria group bacterium]|nr:30S ribosomal protein S4 [Patescibacteria group bacterium]